MSLPDEPLLKQPSRIAMATVANGAVVVIVALLFSIVAVETQSTGRPIEYMIREEIPIGSFVGSVKRNSNVLLKYTSDDLLRLRFHFRHSGQAYRYFSLDERSGDIRTSQVIDRESLCPFGDSCDLSLDISVKPAQYFEIIKVLIRVVDVNDNYPAFPQDRMTLTIAETTLPGALFLIPAAEDADAGLFGVQEYLLMSDHDEFQLTVTDQVDGSKDLRLKLVGRLDREQEERYSITVLAVDGGSPQKTGSVDVEIVVLDANDNSPRFENSSFELEVPEDLPVSTTLIRVEAQDPDDGPNGIVVYSFADATDRAHGELFGIDPTTGDIYLKSNLDYERSQSFQLTIKATDLGSGSLPVFAKVSINVLDVNDNPPQIVVNVLTDSDFAHVRENSGSGTFVAHAAVNDLDSGSNSQVDCSIDNRAQFQLETIGETEYKITTTVTFDREERAYYDVTLTCRDKGDVQLTSVSKIDVRILDENDNKPQIPKDFYEVSIEENNSPGSVLIRINATDADDGRNSALVYTLEPLNDTPDNAVSADLILGKIVARIAFDYEKRSQYAYRIIVSDRGEVPLSSSSTLLLTIIDTNDEAPKFDRSIYYLSTRENQPVGTVVGSVNATDRDSSDQFRLIEYRFLDPNGVFEIHELTGEIRTMKRLDREDIPSYTFIVVAANGPNVETKVNVTVMVEDENDNPPLFRSASRDSPTPTSANRAEITGGSGAGTLVARLIATDADEGPNSELAYSIGSGNAENLFDIDPVTGVIVLARDLPKTSTTQLYRLVVIVRDNGSPQMMSVGDLDVIANHSLVPSMSAQADFGSIFEGSNLLIFIGAGLGFIVVIILIIVAVVCATRRRRRRRGPRGDKYPPGKACDGHLLQQQTINQQQQKTKCRSSSPSCSTKVSRGCGSLTSTMDSNSVRSGGSHLHGCDCRETLMEDETYMDRIPMDWSQQDSGILTSDKCGPSTLDVLPHSQQQQQQTFGPSNRCLLLPRERSCSPHPFCSHHHCSHCCGSSGGGGAGGVGGCGGNSQRHQMQRSPCRLIINPQSPENIPMQTMMKGRHVLDQDLESICSGSTWTDSGRGPSEEEDHIRTQLDPIFSRTALDQSSKEPKRLMLT